MVRLIIFHFLLTYEIEIVQTITHKARTDFNLQQAQVKS
jgi:hypothetical protein